MSTNQELSNIFEQMGGAYPGAESDALEPSLARLTVVVSDELAKTPELEIKLDTLGLLRQGFVKGCSRILRPRVRRATVCDDEGSLAAFEEVHGGILSRRYGGYKILDEGYLIGGMSVPQSLGASRRR